MGSHGMRRHWIAMILLIGLAVGITAAWPTINALLSAAVYWQVRWGQDPDGVGVISAPQRPTLPASPRTMRDLALYLTDLTRVSDGRHTPIEIVEVGDQSYLVLLAGTRLETRPFSYPGNNLESALQQVTRQRSSYEQHVRALIAAHVPAGSTLHLAGHSLGGMVANSLAIAPEVLETYHVATVVTFGTPVNACASPGTTYYRYAVAGDPIALVHQALIVTRLPGPLAVLASNCAPDQQVPAQIIVDHSPGPNGKQHAHSSYEYSEDLGREPLPFEIDRYESLGRFAPAHARPVESRRGVDA
jgi:hypothetical protein